jgi:two-component system CheB/CheR fusion protein
MEEAKTGAARVNRAGAQLLGEPDTGDGLRPVSNLRIANQGREQQSEDQALQKAVRSAEPVTEYEVELVRPDGHRIDVLMSATPLFNEEQKVRGGIAVIVDISALRRGEIQQQVLLHELQHRVKNILTTVGALASRMLKGNRSIDDFAAAFTGRLSAMAKTHELLTASNWEGAELRQLIDATVRSYNSFDGRNISVSGPELVLAPAAASTLGLVFYELATNAMKYGALKERKGRVNISWRLRKLEGREDIDLEWVESDGPVIPEMAKEGFGSGFVRRSVEYELGGKVDLNFQPNGLRCGIIFPRRRNVLAGPNGLGAPSHDSTTD